MAGALDGLKVLDLTRDIAGAVTTMLLADQGAEVTKLEPPGGDPTREQSGARVWHRGKRSAVLELPRERETVLALADRADVLVESFAPGVTGEWGIDFDTLHARNPRLVYCSITAYGRDNRHADRPADPALVAARTGLVWEQRGWDGGPIARMSGGEPNLPGVAAPDGCWDGTSRPGPIYPYTPFSALAAAYLATTAIGAVLHARERDGTGQWVETSQLQGVLAATWASWQRAERPDAPGYDTWICDSRATRGMFECADGRWICYWVPAPAFVLGVSEGDELRPADATRVRDDPDRITPGREELVVLHHYYPAMAAAFRRFPASEWARVGAEVGVALQPVRTPEEALVDPALLATRRVIEVDDPELGPVRQVGITYRLAGAPAPDPAPPPRIGQHTAEVTLEAERNEPEPTPNPPHQPQLASLDPVRTGRIDASSSGGGGGSMGGAAGPLAGVAVIDLGLAVAGPWGTQLLSDLGADVVKVNRLSDQYWHSTHLAMACNRGKRSLAVDLKDPRGMEALHRLVARADVVHHNMRSEAAERLGVGYEALRAVNPQLIYCETQGFDPSRNHLPGNDQTGSALAGVAYEDGGCADGGRPIWSLTSLGDLGNGFLSAIAVVQALYHRDRTGRGQLVDTSILDAQLLNASYAWLLESGEAAPRPRLDADQLGVSATQRLYETAYGWLCLAVSTDTQWRNLCAALERDDLLADEQLSSPAGRAAHDARLWSTLEPTFATRTAADWFDILDAACVPCEICSDTFALEVFDDPEMIERGWVTRYDQALVGTLDQMGMLFDFSATPGRIAGPPLMVGDSSREILQEIEYADVEIDALIEARVVLDTC